VKKNDDYIFLGITELLNSIGLSTQENKMFFLDQLIEVDPKTLKQGLQKLS